MPSSLVSCPFCNARTTLPGSMTAGQRVTCARCGESFVYRLTDEDGSVLDSQQLTVTIPSQLSQRAPRRWSNGVIAGIILGGMCTLALLGLRFALSTVEERRAVDKEKPVVETLSVPWLARIALGAYIVFLAITLVRSWNRGQPTAVAEPRLARQWLTPLVGLAVLIAVGLVLLSIESRPARHARPDNQAALGPVPAVAPVDLPALGFLPPDTNIVAGFHVAEAFQNPLGRELFSNSTLKLGDISLKSLEDWTGLKFPQMDHVVLGIKLDDHFPPRTILVVRTRWPIDEREVRQNLDAKPTRERQGRMVYRFKPDLVGDAYLWRGDDRTLIVVLNAKDLDAIPSNIRPGVEHLPSPLASCLKERVRSATIWAVGHVNDWNNTPLQLLSVAKRNEDWNLVSKLRTFGGWMQVAEAVTFSAIFECATEASAQALLEVLKSAESTNRRALSAVLPRFDHDPLVRELTRTATMTLNGTWIEVHARSEPSDIRKQPQP